MSPDRMAVFNASSEVPPVSLGPDDVDLQERIVSHLRRVWGSMPGFGTEGLDEVAVGNGAVVGPEGELVATYSVYTETEH